VTNTSTESATVFTDAVANSLRTQGIAFRGPFCTPAKRIVFVIENYILLESELVELLGQNRLDRDGIRQLAKRIEAANSRQ
jgi:hypothetical protein